MSTDRIAVVGISCRYPDADSPDELWENVLAGRRAFRRLPDERMRLEDYYSPDPAAPDRFYSQKAAVIEGFEFDRVKYRIAGSTYRSTDMTHWLALDTAARALADAGFPDGEGLNRQGTGVVIGNTLTGEFSRANVMRLRWPYVRRTVGAALREQGWDDDALAAFLDQLEPRYKSPFPPVDEDTLAGGLANTIAGRICNHFDFNGGGYTVDGACSSSLLSVTTACNALSEGHLDAAIAGGVDLSHRPVRGDRLRQDRRAGHRRDAGLRPHSNGFWPGEGCGMLVLMREEDAIAQGLALRHHRRLGLLLRRQGRHHPAGGRRAPAGHRARLPQRRIRLRDRQLPGGPRHRHRRRRRHRTAGLLRRPGGGRPGRAAGRDQHAEGQHRPHQGRGRCRRAAQGDPRHPPPGDPAGHRPPRSAPGAARRPAGAAGAQLGRAVAG